MTAKISSYQLAVLLFLSRLFSECINFPFEYSDYEMQRFTVILISNALLLLIYIPLMIFAAKRPGESFFSVIAEKSKVTGWILFILMSAMILPEAVLSIVKLEFFTSNTLMTDASSWLLIALLTPVAVYGALKGIQALARVGALVLALFVVMIIIGTFSVAGDMNFLYLYPSAIDAPQDFMGDILNEFSKNNELFIFAVLCRYVSDKQGKPSKSVFIYIPALTFTMLYLVLLYIVMFGPYLEMISFPSYTLSSNFNIILFDRLDGLDVIIWTVAAVMKISLFFVCAESMLNSLLKEKTARITSAAIGVAVCAAGLFFAMNYENAEYLSHDLIFTAAVLILVVIMPLIALFIKNNNKKGKNESNENNSSAESKKTPPGIEPRGEIVFNEFD